MLKVLTVDEALEKLKKSRFRSRFSLGKEDFDYINEKGMETIRHHAEDFVRTRLSPAEIANDGKQTPMRGHPVFLAQHATACCCRDCLNKWYKVPKNVTLDDERQRKIVKLLMTWIERQIEEGHQ